MPVDECCVNNAERYNERSGASYLICSEETTEVMKRKKKEHRKKKEKGAGDYVMPSALLVFSMDFMLSVSSSNMALMASMFSGTTSDSWWMAWE